MNTIAILPGGREICPSPCKKTRRIREVNSEEVNISGKVVTGIYGPTGNPNLKNDLQDDFIKYLCAENSNLTLNHLNKQNMLLSAVVAVNLFQDILDVKYSTNAQGKQIISCSFPISLLNVHLSTIHRKNIHHAKIILIGGIGINASSIGKHFLPLQMAQTPE